MFIAGHWITIFISVQVIELLKKELVKIKIGNLFESFRLAKISHVQKFIRKLWKKRGWGQQSVRDLRHKIFAKDALKVYMACQKDRVSKQAGQVVNKLCKKYLHKRKFNKKVLQINKKFEIVKEAIVDYSRKREAQTVVLKSVWDKNWFDLQQKYIKLKRRKNVKKLQEITEEQISSALKTFYLKRQIQYLQAMKKFEVLTKKLHDRNLIKALIAKGKLEKEIALREAQLLLQKEEEEEEEEGEIYFATQVDMQKIKTPRSPSGSPRKSKKKKKKKKKGKKKSKKGKKSTKKSSKKSKKKKDQIQEPEKTSVQKIEEPQKVIQRRAPAKKVKQKPVLQKQLTPQEIQKNKEIQIKTKQEQKTYKKPFIDFKISDEEMKNLIHKQMDLIELDHITSY